MRELLSGSPSSKVAHGRFKPLRYQRRRDKLKQNLLFVVHHGLVFLSRRAIHHCSESRGFNGLTCCRQQCTPARRSTAASKGGDRRACFDLPKFLSEARDGRGPMRRRIPCGLSARPRNTQAPLPAHVRIFTAHCTVRLPGCHVLEEFLQTASALDDRIFADRRLVQATAMTACGSLLCDGTTPRILFGDESTPHEVDEVRALPHRLRQQALFR